MELLILCLCILLYRPSRPQVWKGYQYPTKPRIAEIDEMDRRIQVRLRNAQQYLEECERTGNEEYLEFAREERDKVYRMIEDFKKENRI